MKTKEMRKPTIGDTIKIISLKDEPFSTNYTGKTGVVTEISKDCYGEERMSGTWGGIWVYIDEDVYEIISH